MANNDFKVANLSDEQMHKLIQFENQLGVTLIAYEHTVSQIGDPAASPKHD